MAQLRAHNLPKRCYRGQRDPVKQPGKRGPRPFVIDEAALIQALADLDVKAAAEQARRARARTGVPFQTGDLR